MKALIRIRFKCLFWGWKQTLFGQPGKKKRSPILVGLLCLLLLYVVVVLGGMMVVTFLSLSPLVEMDMGWLYFAVAFLMGSAFTIFGSVYTTQNQLYNAKDNALLLSMPVTMQQICLSRLIPLLCSSAFYMALVTLPAICVYLFRYGLTAGILLGFLAMFLCMTLICQTLSCILGWVLHQILSRVRNKAVGSLLFMVLFLVLYFWVYGKLMTSLESNAGAITDMLMYMANLVQGWGFIPLQIGMACGYSITSCLIILLITLLICAAGYSFLIITYRHALVHTVSHSTVRIHKTRKRISSPVLAICRKECRKFFTSSVYLTNMGIGILMILAAAVAGVLLRNKIDPMLAVFPLDMRIPAIMGILGFTLSTAVISAPSISLEGKNLWILAALPLSCKTILWGKLLFHLIAVLPVSALCVLVLGITYGLSPLSILCVLLYALAMGTMTGAMGLLFNLRFPRFDWINEAYPCKQSVATGLGMFVPMAIGILSPVLYLLLIAVGLGVWSLLLSVCLPIVLCAVCLWLLLHWGERTLETLLTEQ